MRMIIPLWLWSLHLVAYSQTLQKAEYFFDNDPGCGQAQGLPIAAAAAVSATFSIPTAGLGEGLHTFSLRVQDDQGQWSLFAPRLFYLAAIDQATRIVGAEYFMDFDPGMGKGEPLTLAPGAEVTNLITVRLDPLSSGFHRLGFRYVDDHGVWSHFAPRLFFIMPLNTLPAHRLERVEYFVDLDPGYGAGKNLLPIPWPSMGGIFLLDLMDILPGNHWLHMRARDSQGYWSEVVSTPFYITGCEAPPPPTVTAAARCGPGTVQMTASGASNFQRYRWYDSAEAGNLVSTTDRFETPVLTSSRFYYVSIRDVEAACESARIPVLAEIRAMPPKPVITIDGPTQLCRDETITLTGPPGYTYIWSTGEEAQSITVRGTASVTFAVQDGYGCVSELSDPVQIERLVPEPVITQEGYVLTGAGIGSAFQWYFNGQPVQDGVDNTLELGPFDFGTYAVVASLGACYSRSADYLYLITHVGGPHGDEPIRVVNPVHYALQIRNGSGQTAEGRIVDGLGREVWRGAVDPGLDERPAAFMTSGVYYFIYRTRSQYGVIKLAKYE